MARPAKRLVEWHGRQIAAASLARAHNLDREVVWTRWCQGDRGEALIRPSRRRQHQQSARGRSVIDRTVQAPAKPFPRPDPAFEQLLARWNALMTPAAK